MSFDLPSWCTVRDVLEVLYFVAGIVIACAAVAALWQIKVAKDDIRTRSRREATELAAKQCGVLSEKLIPAATALRKQLEAKNLAVKFALNDARFVPGSLAAKPEVTEAWLGQMTTAMLIAPVIKHLNDLEAFAMYFASGAADEELAYTVAAATFCFEIESYAPVLIRLKALGPPRGSGQFANVCTLYKLWSERLAKDSAMVAAMKAGLTVTDETGARIPPIGT